jgi:arylsulfatase A-like enzyme
LFRLLVLCLLAAALGGGIFAQTSQAPKGWSVLLITVDCLRPDHMSVYGYARDTTPNLAKLARESLVFENAFSSSAWTTPSLSALMTGYPPSVHGQNGRYGFYDKRMPSPLRQLADAGYDVFGTDIKGPGHEDFGYQGKPAFDRPYLENFIAVRAANPKPFFTWTHLDDLHLPYTPTAKNANRWLDTSSRSEGVQAVREYRVILRHPQEGLPFKHAGSVTFTPADQPIIRALYDGELADVDERLGVVLEQMRDNGLLDRTLVVITADHGEELFDHGWVGHPSTSYDGKLYDELIRIPLIVRLPDRSKTGRFGALVQGVDLMPTLLELLDIDTSKIDPPMQGTSLMALVTGVRKELHPQLFMQTTLKGWTTPKEEVPRRVLAVRTIDRKLMLFPQEQGTRIEAYNLRSDPGETKNLYPSRARKFRDLQDALAAWQKENAGMAARLVQGAADKHLAALEQALQGGDVLAAVREWEAVETMQLTWGLEPQPFYSQEPYAAPWKALRHRMSGEITAAIDCATRDKTFRFIPPSGSGSVASVACDE